MAKKAIPIITHTEIYARAIRHVEAEIDKWRSLCADFQPENEREQIFNASTEELRNKLEALKEMYRIETGTEYD